MVLLQVSLTCHQPVNTIPMVVNSDTIVYMCVEAIISQPDRFPESLMICQTSRMGGHQLTSGGRRNVEETLPTFGMSFAKPFLLKIVYSKCSKIVEFWTFYSSVFVNMTNIVVKSYTVLHMGVEAIICQSEMSPERLMISQIPSIGDIKSAQVGEGK